MTNEQGSWDNPAPYCKRRSGANYFLTTGGRYALFKGELIRLRNRFAPVLLVTDIGGTLIEMNQHARESLDTFHRHWVKYYLFSGSKLVYNTGHSLESY
jgi:hypothetical protein